MQRNKHNLLIVHPLYLLENKAQEVEFACFVISVPSIPQRGSISTASRPALGTTQSTIQGYWGVFSRGIVAGPEADHPPPSMSRLRMHGAILSLPHTSSWHGASLDAETTLPFITEHTHK
jgi:hypothetical protein